MPVARRPALPPALAVEIVPDDVQVGDATAHHPVEGAASSEESPRIRTSDPGVRGFGTWQQDLQRLVDSENVRDSLKRIGRRMSVLRPGTILRQGRAGKRQQRLLFC